MNLFVLCSPMISSYSPVPEYSLIGLIVLFILIYAVYFFLNNERIIYLIVAVILVFLLGALFYWNSLCENQIEGQRNMVIVYEENLENLPAIESSLRRNGYEKIDSCKSNPGLQLWSAGRGVFQDIQSGDGLADGSNPRARGANGDELGVDIALNLEIKIPENNLESNSELISELKNFPKGFSLNTRQIGSHSDDVNDNEYIIAVTDTQIDTSFNYVNLWENNSENFENFGKNGWNFVKENDSIFSKLPLHATFVTYLLERELKTTSHKFLPLITLDENKRGFLFDALCAFEEVLAYNQMQNSKKIRVINASWGYYGKRNWALEKGLTRLKNGKVLLVAAAGNSDSECDRCEKLDAKNLRNVSMREKMFYPAAYSPIFENVISVTTFNINGDIFQAANQNYSDEFIDIGVQSDNYRTGDYLFHFPFILTNTNENTSKIFERKIASWGSSFSTPIVTAHIFSKNLAQTPVVESLDYQLDGKDKLLDNGYGTYREDLNYKIESTWRATNLSKNGKVLLKKY
ncbi:S8 family serine peptidase [Lacihabitans soyangensis]|uniref:Peptidase S8/S53 domain-containing protein n=1 Tax=Lacihabitans soyangensis TaxID=869394 RepID=A0AAE3H762_9BACT|nr:S8 family serine peptidase [Lacihabitans soyangensis]MCP9766038.1 hypothetical protein [Lacihabitans soyangensis]